MSVIALVAFIISLSLTFFVTPQAIDTDAILNLDVCKTLEIGTSSLPIIIGESMIIFLFFPLVLRLESPVQISYSSILTHLLYKPPIP